MNLNHTLQDIWDAQSARQGYDRAIDKMEAKMESMRSIPDWGVGLIVGLSLVALVCCFQLLIMMLTMPCMYSWDYCWEARRQRLRDEQFTANDPDDPDALDAAEAELTEVPESEGAAQFGDVIHKPYTNGVARKNGKAEVSDLSYDMTD